MEYIYLQDLCRVFIFLNVQYIEKRIDILSLFFVCLQKVILYNLNIIKKHMYFKRKLIFNRMKA